MGMCHVITYLLKCCMQNGLNVVQNESAIVTVLQTTQATYLEKDSR